MIAAGGATPTPSYAITPTTGNLTIGGGFSASLLPETLDQLRPSMVYPMTGGTNITDAGMQFNVASTAIISLDLIAQASPTLANPIVWMQNLIVQASDSPVIIDPVNGNSAGQNWVVLQAKASGAGMSAETGIIHTEMDQTGVAVNERLDIQSTAAAGASATSNFGDIVMNGTASQNTAPSQVHMGIDEPTQAGYTPGMLAQAQGAGSHAAINVSGNMTLTGAAATIYTYSSGIDAHATTGGTAHVGIGGNIGLTADAVTSASSPTGSAHTYLVLDSTTDTGLGSAADVHIGGNVSLNASGDHDALDRLLLHAGGDGVVSIAGTLTETASGPSASDYLQLVAQGGSGHIDVSAIDFNVNDTTNGSGWLDLYTDHAGGLNIGALNISTGSGSQTYVELQHATGTTGGGNVDFPNTFLSHPDGTNPVSIAAANVNGTGDVHMFLNSQGFTTINQASGVDLLDLEYSLTGHYTSIENASAGSSLTTLNGFTGAHDKIVFNADAASATNFTNAGSFSSLTGSGGMDAAVTGDLTATNHYVFAVYTGSADALSNGTTLESGSGVLAYGASGSITSVVLLPNVTSVTPTDLA